MNVIRFNSIRSSVVAAALIVAGMFGSYRMAYAAPDCGTTCASIAATCEADPTASVCSSNTYRLCQIYCGIPARAKGAAAAGTLPKRDPQAPWLAAALAATKSK